MYTEDCDELDDDNVKHARVCSAFADATAIVDVVWNVKHTLLVTHGPHTMRAMGQQERGGAVRCLVGIVRRPRRGPHHLSASWVVWSIIDHNTHDPLARPSLCQLEVT